jgi:hypothetical protein
VLFVVGMIVSQGSEANFVPVAMVLLGTTVSRRVLITPGMRL